MRIRTADALALFDGSNARLREVFPSELRGGKVRKMTRQAVHRWGEYLPELRARQLVEARPDAAALIVGEDGLTAVERALAKQGGVQVERGATQKPATVTDEASRG